MSVNVSGEQSNTMRLRALYEARILEAQKNGDIYTMQVYAQLISNLILSNNK